MIHIDHITIPAHDVEGAAQFLCDILDLPKAEPDGPDSDMRCVTVSANSSVLYYPSRTSSSHHVAFRVDANTFLHVVDRLREKSVLFGNDPEENNGQTTDPQGGHGRVYVHDPNGHVFEVLA
jgi:catechol 2,3-dioxygenase-like lactoylglutathione lyase family enzyme